MKREFDIVIVGGGPAGLTAGLYAARAGKNVVLLENTVVGGQAAITNEIENYPGFVNISGFELASTIEKQAKSFGMKTLYENATSIDLKNKTIQTNKGEICAKAIILCMGAAARKLGIEGEEGLIGKGISYCAICDGAFFRDKNVAVVGGGNTAAGDVLYLKNIAASVTLIHRRDEMRATKVLADKITLEDGVDKKFGYVVTRLIGEDKLEAVEIESTNGRQIMPLDALFVAIGHNARTELVKGQLKLDDFGYIVTAPDMSVEGYEGIYAAGDIRSKDLRQVITACSDGAIAGENAAASI